MSMTGLVRGLNQFHSNYFNSHQELFEKLSHGQTPEVLFITCSDSRIDPCLITQTQPGELFVMRNVGNIIPTFRVDSNSEGAGIEYAICALGIKDVIVCGHSHCGAMKGLLQIGSLTEEMPLVYDWLRHHAESTRRLVLENYRDCDSQELLKIATEQNVLTQIENLETYPVIRSRLHSGQISLHAWIYDLETGTVLAYNAAVNQFSPLEKTSFPVPDLLAQVHSDHASF